MVIFQSYTVIIPQGVCQRALVIILILVNVAAKTLLPIVPDDITIHISNRTTKDSNRAISTTNRVLEGTQPPVFW